MILAGDIGGTHARLAFFDAVDGRFSLVSASIFPSREYSGLDEIVAKFVDYVKAASRHSLLWHCGSGAQRTGGSFQSAVDHRVQAPGRRAQDQESLFD